MTATSAVRIEPASSPPLSVVCADDSHAAALAAFYRALGRHATTAAGVVRARHRAALLNDVQPGEAPPAFAAMERGRILGLVGTTPARLWDGRKTWPAYWLNGPVVRPDTRSGRIGPLLLRAAVAHVGRALALVPRAAQPLFTAAGCTDMGPVQNWMQPLAKHPAEVARPNGIVTVSGWAADHVGRAVSARLRMQGREIAADHEVATPRELDELWHATRASFPSGHARDSHYLLHRYDPTRGERYLWIAAREHGLLRGIAILREPRPAGDERLDGINVSVLSDLLYAPDRPDVGRALLLEVENLARQLNADAVLASGSAASMQSVLKHQGYVPVSSTMHLFHHDVPGAGATFAADVDGWWVTRGDALADEAF